MHEPTNPLAESPDAPLRRWAEIARVASSKAPGGTLPAGTRKPPAIARISDAIAILRAKRDRYKSAGKADKANTVESCIQTLKEWAK